MLTFSTRERHMLLVALDCLIIEFKQTVRRAKRRKSPNLGVMAEDSIKRYTKLANKVARKPHPLCGR